MNEYTQPTAFIDCDTPQVAQFSSDKVRKAKDPVTQAVKLYYAVRDGIRYDPYAIDLTVNGLKASTTLKNERGWCVAKAVLLAACCRHMGIAARLGFADVKNHLSTERMRQQMQTDVFYWHGYTAIYLNEQWVKATPAFNIELCEKFALKPLEFDGLQDSIYHPFDLKGNRHMDYIHHRGEFADVPLDQIIATFRREYQADDKSATPASFEADVAKETGR